MSKYFQTILDAISGKEQEYTSGSIDKAIVLLSIPMVLEMMMEGIFALADAYWVSKISVDAMATVGLTESIMTMVYSIAVGLCAAATAMVARRIGEGDPDGASKSAIQSTVLAIAISILIGVPGYIFAEDILRLMGGSEALIAECSGYTRIMFGGNIVIMLIFLFNAIFRGAGNATYAMWVLFISNGINIVLDPMLIFGWGPFPELGIKGAAIATNIGRGVGVAMQLYLLLKGVGMVKIARKHFVVVKATIVRLIEVAAGGTGQYIISSASWVFLVRIVSEFGSEAVAGYTIAIRIIIFTFMPIWGMGNAAATLVGQNLGAKLPDRAEASAWRTAHFTMLFLIAISVVLIFGAPVLIPLFNPASEVVRVGIFTLRIFCVSYFIFAYGLVLSQSFNGAGDTRTPTMVNFVCFWLIEIPLGYFLAMHTSLEVAGVCWSVAISEALMSVVLIYLFRKGKWKLVTL
ncbi:MAG: MATE family efflux transporter [Lewinellaceae bacterium]|nr:MATE family efflux transporter [Saprospiraceae bacterium]MCB9340753.1 MATE family efflux transporter [Lewinellaceae bacterium]